MSMKINDKLIKPITEVNYLRAENVERYRVIVRFFFEQYEKINYWLYKEDVYQAMKETELFEDYTMDMCQSDLQALVEWKNLIAMQDSSKVTTIEEFRNRKFRYQLSEYTIEIERMTLRLENIEVEGASLEPTLLERIHHLITQIPEIKDQSEEKVSIWWNDLNENFIRLNRNYQDYLRTLNSSKAEEMMKTQSFLIYKEKIIMYLRNFVKGLQEQAMILEDYINDIPNEDIEALLQKAVTYELSIPRIDVQVNEEDIYELFKGRWKSIFDWFVGTENQSEVNRMSDITNEMIRKITRYAQQIGEMQNQGANKMEEYRHIAKLFENCSTLSEGHKLSAMLFGVDHALHLKELNPRETDSIDSGVYEEKCTEIALEARTRIATKKTKRKPAENYNFEIEQNRLAILQQQEDQLKKLKSYIVDGVVDFSKIKNLDAQSRKILFSWLSKGLSNEDKSGKTDNGERFVIDTSNQEMIQVQCEDGVFTMPSFRICFKGEM